MLHGFAGTGRAYEGVIAALPPERYTPIALDLPGHGARSEQAAPITYEDCVESVLASAPSCFALCGYSMGARVALQVALAAPRRVSRLVLVSATAGLQDEVERAARRHADEQLAKTIEQGSIERFVERWRSQPLFADEPPEVRRLAAADHRRNTTLGLAAALRGIGPGAMEPLWERLRELTMPVMVLVGERDEKYKALGKRIAGAVPDGRLRVVAGGHGLLLENPDGVAAAIAGMPRAPSI